MYCLPKTTNDNVRLHWRVKHVESLKLKSRVKTQVVLHGPPPAPLDKARVTLERHSSSEPDFDGLVSGFKFILDGLVDAGVLINDKMSVIGAPIYIWKKAKKCAGKVKITVEEI